MPISPVDAVGPAFHHAKRQLFQPFRITEWLKLALIGFLAGELTSGGCSFSSNYQIPYPGGPHRLLSTGLPMMNPMLYAATIAILIVAGAIFFILFIYVNSVMRFVLFDAIVAKRSEIIRSWNLRQRPGLRYFFWQIILMLGTVAGLAILVGIPAAIAFAAGWLQKARQHLIPLILFGIVVFFCVMAWFLLSMVAQVLAKDFVVPQMALEDIGPLQAWRRLLPMIRTEKGSYAGYLGLKIVMTLGAAVVLGIIAGILILLMLIPVGGFGAIAVLIGKGAGLTWNLYTISLAVVIGTTLVVAIIYLISFISVPATVFFPAYALYFFASRYPALSRILYPDVSLPPANPLTTPLSPSPIG